MRSMLQADYDGGGMPEAGVGSGTTEQCFCCGSELGPRNARVLGRFVMCVDCLAELGEMIDAARLARS